MYEQIYPRDRNRVGRRGGPMFFFSQGTSTRRDGNLSKVYVARCGPRVFALWGIKTALSFSEGVAV